MANESTQWLYDQLKGKGYNVGKDVAEFDSLMRSNADSRKWAYETAKKSGLNVGKDIDEFSSLVGGTAQAAAPSSTPATPVEEVKPDKSTAPNRQEAKQEKAWQPTPMQKAFMAHSAQSAVDRFKATTDAMLEQTQNSMDYYRKGGGITGVPVKGKVAFNTETGKAEQTYLTPTGKAMTDKAAAERETRAYNEYVDNMTVAGQLRRAGRDLQELHRKRNARVQAIHDEWAEDYKKNTAPLAAVLSAGTYQPSIEGDQEYRALTAAIHQAEKRVQTLQHENDRQQGKDVGFWRGFGEVVGDIKTWDFGYSGMMDAMTMLDAAKPSPKARPKTEGQKSAQQTMLEQTAEAQAAQAAYGQNDSFWNRAGVMTGEMLPFMLDFALMGGSNSGTSAVTRTIDAALLKALRSQAPKAARNKAVQWTVKALGAMPEDLLYRAPLMANTVQGMKTASDIIDRKLGDVVVREDGTYDFSNDKSWGSAIWQGEANAIIENYSEMFGTHLEGVLSLKTLGKIADTFGAKRLSGVLARASSSELAGIAGTMQKHLNQLGVSDYFGEVGEEYYGQLWRTMLNLDDAYRQNPDGSRTNLFLDGQFHGDIWGGMALSMGLMGAGKYTLSAAAYGSMKHRVNKTDTRAAEIFTPEVWETWRDRIDGTPNADIGAMAESIIGDTSLTPEQRDAAMNYMEASLNLRGFNLSSIARQRGEEQSAEEAAANESYMDGYAAITPQEMNDAKRMLDLQRQRLASSLSDDMVAEYDSDPIGMLSQTTDPELRRIAADYVNAKQVYDGMIQRVRDDVDARIAQSDAMIESRVNRQTGMIQPATMKIDDRQVYIVNGNITMYEDGTGVDTENSSESIIIRDAETGKIEFADPAQVLDIGEVIDAEEEKETARQQITQEIAQSAANNIDGILSFAPGETYSVLDIDGNPEEITILGNSMDEDGMPLMDGSIDIQYPDGTIQSVPTADLQQWVDAANDRRVAQFAEERAAERAAADEADRQADTSGLSNPNRDRSLLPDNWEMPYYGFNTTASRYIESERGTGGILYQDEQGNDAIVISAIDDHNYVGYFREYDEQGQPTNRWSAKFQNGSGLRENHRDMMQTAQELLPAGHELTEHTNVSTDGLRNLANQLKHGYELQYDEQGNVITERVPLNMMARENDLDLLNYEPGTEDASASFRDEAHRTEVISRLGELLAPFGLDENAVTIEDGRIYVEHPVLRRADTPEEGAEQSQAESQAAEPGWTEETFGDGGVVITPDVRLSDEEINAMLNGESVPNTAENVPKPTENGVSEGETAPEADSTVESVQDTSPRQSALSQIPTDEKGDTMYEAVDADLAWDGLMEETEDEQIAQNVIAQEIAEREDTLKKLSKQKPKAGLSTKEKIKAEKEKKNMMDDIQKSIDHWKRMATTTQRRKADEDSKRAEEARRRAEERRAQEEQARAEREEAERKEREALNGVPDWSHDTPQDARARGYRRYGPEKVDRQKPIQTIDGKAIEVKFGEKELPKGKYALIDISALQPSHIDGMRNPRHFIDEAQPKERTDAASREAARKIASNIRPEEITSSVTAYTGAPTVNSRGETIQGNSRSAALRLMYESYPGEAAKYKKYLKEHASEYGLTAEQIEGMEKPALVNMIDVDDQEAIRLGQFVSQDTESGGTERIKDKNTVKKMGAKIRNFANILLRSTDDEASFAQLVDSNGKETLKWMAQNGFINDTQYASAFDSKGNLTGEAANDLKGILYQSIFTGGSTRLEEMFNNLPAKAQRAILATAFRDYDSSRADRMIEEIQQSIMAYNDMMEYEGFSTATNMKDATGAMEAWKRQYAMDDVTGEPFLPAEKFSNFALTMAAMYKGGTQRFIQQTFNDLYDSIQGTEQDNLFEEGDKTPKSMAEAIKKVLDLEYKPIKTQDNEGNDRSGSDAMDLDTTEGEAGRPGSERDAEHGEQEQDGGRRADSGTGTSEDSGARNDVGLFTAEETATNADTLFTPEEIAAITGHTFTHTNGDVVKLTGHTTLWDGRPAFIGTLNGQKGGRFMHNLVRIMLDKWQHDVKMPEKQEETPAQNAEEQEAALQAQEAALAARIEVNDNDWTEGEGKYPTHKRTITVDGRHTVTQIDAPNAKGEYVGSQYEYDGKTFGSLPEAVAHIDTHPTLGQRIEEAEAEVNTDPTPAQKEAGNYKKGHVQVGTFDVTIENPKGSTRSGVDADGKKWETTMTHTYGYIRGTASVDGDHIDVYLSSDIDGWNGRKVFVVDQYNPDGTFDEHKVMLGFNGKGEAIQAYLSNYEEGWEKTRRLAFSTVSIEDFEKWIESSHRKQKPFAEYRSVHVEETHEGGKDPLHDEVKQWLGMKGLEPEEASRSAVMRYFKIGYNRAGQILNAISAENAAEATEEQPATNGKIDPWNAFDRVVFAKLPNKERMIDVGWDKSNGFPAIYIEHPTEEGVAAEITFDGTKWKVSVVPVKEWNELSDRAHRIIDKGMQPAKQRDYIDKYVPKELQQYFESGQALKDNNADPDHGAKDKVYAKWGIIFLNADTHYTNFNNEKEKSETPATEQEPQNTGKYKVGERLSMGGIEVEVVSIHNDGKLDLRGPSVGGIEQTYIGISPEKVYKPGSDEAVAYWYGVKKAQFDKMHLSRADAESMMPKVEAMLDKAAERAKTDKSFEAVEQFAQALAMEQVLNDIIMPSQAASKPDAAAPSETADKSAPYTIEAKPYTNKSGKTLDTYLVTFTQDLSKDEKKRVIAMAKARKGWYDRETGGFMLRSKEDAEDFAKSVIGINNAIESDGAATATVSLSDIKPETESNTATTTGKAEPSATTEPSPGDRPAEAAKPEKKKSKWVDEEDAEEFERLRNIMRNGLGQLNMGFPPELLYAGGKMSYLMMKHGVRKFAEYATAMIEELGDAIRPHLKALYNFTRSTEEVMGSGWANELTPFDEVMSFDTQNFDKPTADAMATAENIVKEEDSQQHMAEAQEQLEAYNRLVWVYADWLSEEEGFYKAVKNNELDKAEIEGHSYISREIAKDIQTYAKSEQLKMFVDEWNKGDGSLEGKIIAEAIRMAKKEIEKEGERQNPDGSTTRTEEVTTTENGQTSTSTIEVTEGDFIPGVRPTPEGKQDKPVKKKPSKPKEQKPKPKPTGQLDLFGEEEEEIINDIIEETTPPEPKPEAELSGDSAEYQERQRQERDLTDDIVVEIMKRTDMRVGGDDRGPLTMREVRGMLENYPLLSDISATDLQELVERAMTILTRTTAKTWQADPRKGFDRVVAYYNTQPSLNARDSERLIKQQYSTPTPFGYVMGQFVNSLHKNESVLEPSAGNGALTIMMDPKSVHVNDIDERRLENLRALGYGQVTAQNGLLPFEGEKVDAVLTNPPFGTVTEKTYDGIFKISSLEGQMAINALDSMKDGGRAAIIIGGNTSYRTNGSMNPKDAAFFGYLYSHYNVVDVINISGKSLYARNGTGYDVRMILIAGRKTGEFERVYPPVKAKARAEQVTTFDELYNRVQDDILQVYKMGHKPSDEKPESGTAADGGESAPDGSGSNKPDKGTGERPDKGGTGIGSASGTHSAKPSSGNEPIRTDRVDNGDGGNAGGTDNVQRPKPSASGSRGSDGAKNDGGGEGGNGHGTAPTRPNGGGERLSVKPDLTTEKVPYPNQSENGLTLLSVVPAAQAEVLQRSLGEIGDVDQFLVDNLGYSSKEELFKHLAAEQIDSVALAIHQMNKGNAFIIGDMTGVGKGRQGAALIRYAVKQGKCPIYFTQKPTLFTDNYRDLEDIGSSGLRPFIIASNPKDANIVDKDGNIVHKLPSQKERERVYDYILQNWKLPPEYDYVLTTYDQIKNGTEDYTQNEDGSWNREPRKLPKKSKGYTTADYNGQARRDVLARLALGTPGDGNIAILDESHTVGGDSGCGRYMQMLTYNAGGVTFLSATFAKRADNMPIYAQRTAISEAGVKANELIEAIAKGGVTLQEIMSKQLVESGQMIRRERSFEGVTIDWLSVEEETDRKQRAQFNEVANIFNAIRNFQNDYIKPIIDGMNEAAAEQGATVGQTQGTKDLGVRNTPFASKMYNLVNQLLFALKVDAVADRVIENLRNGFKPVISFTNTMEGFLANAPKGVAMDEVPNFSLTLMRALDGVMRYTKVDADSNSDGDMIPLSQLSPEGQNAYNAIKEQIMNLSADLPISPMDAIRMKIEEAGYSVAEITGRTTQLNKTEDGKYIVETRADRDKKAAMRDFNAGKLDVLMINKSGSTGISLHASSKFEDQRQRVMVFAQFQSDINDEVQMRGRIDRSGQVVRGRYEYIMSTIPAEQRIQMMFKAKLKSLDANTTSSQKSKFNEMEIVDYLNKYGDEVVWEYMKEHPELSERLGDPLKMLSDKKDDDTARNSDNEDTSQKADCAGKISRYLAFLSVEEQDEIFKEITEAYKVKIQLLDDAGENDLEITTMPLRAETKNKQIWHRGENPGSGNAFADNTYVEEVEVDVLKKPMKRNEIDDMTRKLMGDKLTTATEYDQKRYGFKEGELNWGRYADNMIQEVNTYFGNKADDTIEKMKEAAAKRVAKAREKAVKDALKARAKGENTFSDQEIESLADVVAKEAQDKEDYKQFRRREEINAVRDHIKHLFSRLRAGHIYVVPQDLKQATADMFTQTFGTFVGFKFNKSYTLGSSTAIFATLDGRRKVELALNDKAIETIIRCTDTAVRYSPREINAISMDNWDSKVPSQTRQKRYIITGNLLQALVDTEKGEKTKGNLISYSTMEGDTRQGILMSENFKPTDLRSSVPLRSRLKQIQDGMTVVSENGDVQIEKITMGWEHRGDYELRVPKSKQKGGLYTMNTELLKLVDGKNFVTKGNNMVGYVAPNNIAKVVDMLSHSPFNLTVLEESKLAEAKEQESTDEELRFRPVEDPNLAAELDSQPSVKAYRAMQVIDGKLYSPMASGKKKSLSASYGLNQWDVATELAFNFTDEMMAEVERLNNSRETGTVDVIPGQLKFEKKAPGGKCSLLFHLKTDETDVWAAYNPYNHNSDSMLNDQFKAAYRRGNLVVVEAQVPIPDLESGYQAPYSKDPVGQTEWKSGDVAAQLPEEMKRTVYLSRYCKPLRVLSNKEVAKWIGERLKKAEKLTGKKITLYEACFHPEVKRLLEKQGFSFVPVKPTKGKVSKILSGHRDYMSDAKIAELNKSLGVNDEWLGRHGDGEFTDDELSYINDPWSRAWGKSLHYKKQRTKYAERMRNAMREKVRSLTEPYGIEVEILEDTSGLEGKKKTSKGWFDPRTGKVVIVLPNNSSTEDIQATLLHEVVAHKGLRDLFGDKFDNFLDAVYEHAENDVKERIDLLATQNGWNRRVATEEYLAMLAEDATWNNVNHSWWSKLKALFMDFLRSCGFSANVKISDNELRYVLYMSWQNQKNPGAYRSFLGEAERVAKEYELGVGEYSPEERPADAVAENELRFRDGDFTVRDRKMAAHIYERMLSTGSYQFREAMQDSMLGLKKLYQAILGKDKRMEDIASYENAYLYENRMSSANNGEQHQYFVRYMTPLLKSVHDLCGKDELERRTLTDYMMAKHGLERNEYMRNEAAAAGEKTDRDFAGLCGLTGEADWAAAEAAAQQMVDDYENDHNTTELWDNVRKATTATLEKIWLTGLISEDTYNKVLDMYDYYIPLRGWDETTSDEVYGYLTSKDGPLMGSVFKHAEGRESKADDPIATIAMMADDAIRQGNRNVMKQRFLNFVHGNPSNLVSVTELWLQYNSTKDEWEPVFADLEPDMTNAEVENEIKLFEEKMEGLAAAEPDKYKRGRDARNIPYKVVRGNMDEHQVLVKRNGHTYVMTINGNPRAAQALNGLTNPNVETGGVIGNMLKAGEWINRNLSAFYTTRNPDFVMSNFLRDMLYSNAMTWVKENPRYALRFHKNFGRVNPARLYGLLKKWEDGSLSDSNYLERMMKEFMLNGGETGYTSVKDIEGHKRTIASELKKQGSAGRKAWAALGKQLDLLNRCAENCARFAAFLTSREMGRPLDRSIFDAKEISVNFNKKGSGGKFVNATGQKLLGKIGSYLGGGGRIAYVFWNAGVQGLTNFGRAGKRNPGKALTGAAALFALGSVIPLLAQLLGGGDGDDDDKNAYYNLPEYVRRSNICFKAGDQWITIPLPIEYRAIYGLGELSTGVISGNERYSNTELTRQMAAQVSQILPLDMLEGGGGAAPFIPSAAKPFTEAYIMNKGWTGLPVYKDTPFNKNDPEWTKAYQSADQHLVGFARWLNETTGGDDYKKGKIDINPAKLEYLLNGTFGGMMTFPMKIKKTGETAFGDREFEWRNLPLANRVVKSGDERTANRKLQNEYFKYKAEAEETDRLRKKYENAADGGIMEYAEKVDFLYNSNEYLRYEIFKEFEPEIDSIREEIKAETDRTAKKEIEAELYATMRELVDALHEIGK